MRIYKRPIITGQQRVLLNKYLTIAIKPYKNGVITEKQYLTEKV